MWWLISVGAIAGAGAGWCARRTASTFVGNRTVRCGWCESLCAAGVAVTVWCGVLGRDPEPALLPVAALFWWWCVSLVATDWCARRLPNALTLPGFAVIVVLACAAGRAPAALVGGALLATVYLGLHLCAPRSLGAGDVKLALGVGAAAAMGGGGAWVWAALLAPTFTAAAGCVALVRARWRRSRSTPDAPSSPNLPHGPAMCAATVLALLATHLP
ncbi:prepilin peptidase [Rhodococcus tibetensis]|uniref:Prepilin peptidase n=1 Tax=Rhodococcus tibetensis TaxID=2965064 RepID=A0ABT1Q8J8_9NOCA|nr:A24 family peptidase [Rhodococcus sp. FXJ9.536]MCQ4118584.1 prepilin peptidase [Rhodococcus sp. FXJ9.536]